MVEIFDRLTDRVHARRAMAIWLPTNLETCDPEFLERYLLPKHLCSVYKIVEVPTYVDPEGGCRYTSIT